MSVRIRAIRPEDFPELHALDRQCFAPGIAYSKAELHYFLRYPGNVNLAADVDNGALAGFAIAGLHRRRGSLVGRIITIDVRPECRRQGVGHALMDAMELHLRQAGATAVILEVAVDNLSAQSFYAGHGFTQVGRIPGYYLGRIDALVLEKPLDSGGRPEAD